VADLLSALRLLLAFVFPALLAYRSPLALTVWAIAALSDFADGRIARRRGSSPRGAVLDVVADVAFVLGGLTGAAALGIVPVATPVAVGGAVAAYALASARLTAGGSALRLARSRVGHWAGIANWACVGLVAGSVASPGGAWTTIVPLASWATAALNVAAVVTRVRPRRLAAQST
jgi:phosphatidylglycerophosphate synthase